MTQLNLPPELLRWYFPIYGVTVHGKVLVIHRSCKMKPPTKGKKGNRKNIKAINRKSLDLLLYKVLSSGISFRSMMTCTYGANWPVNGERVKDDINWLITDIKRSMGQMSYFWFLEFQRRSAPHIHIVSTLAPPGQCERELFATIWSKIASPQNLPYTACYSPYGKKNGYFGMYTQDAVFRQHRREDNWEGIRKKDGAIRYVLKYAKKQYQKAVPKEYRNVGRFWATSRDVSPPKALEVPMTDDEVRMLAHTLGRDFSNWEMLPKFIFIS